MLARATGLFSIYRGTTTNLSGDVVDDNTNPLHVDVPLSLHNAAIRSDNPNSATPRSIGGLTGRASSNLDLRTEDRIQHQVTGYLYVVDWVRAPASSTRNSDLRFECHRVN